MNSLLSNDGLCPSNKKNYDEEITPHIGDTINN